MNDKIVFLAEGDKTQVGWDVHPPDKPVAYYPETEENLLVVLGRLVVGLLRLFGQAALMFC